MKKLALLLFAISTTALGQICTRSGTFYNGDGTSAAGTAYFERLANGDLQIRFENFSVTSGPDLDVYLTDVAGNPTTGNYVNVSAIQTSGHVYVVPASVEINQFTHIAIHCTQYNHWFGSAELTSQNGDCSPTSVQNLEINPVITSNESGVQINTEISFSGTVSIYTMNGQLISETTHQGIHSTIPLNYSGWIIIQGIGDASFTKRIYLR